MKKYNKFIDLLDDAWIIKKKVTSLDYEGVMKIQHELYSMGFPEWKINVLWDFIWEYKSFKEMVRIFKDDIDEDYNRL